MSRDMQMCFISQKVFKFCQRERERDLINKKKEEKVILKLKRNHYKIYHIIEQSINKFVISIIHVIFIFKSSILSDVDCIRLLK